MYEKMDDYSYACLDLLNDVCITLGKLAVECAKENEIKATAVYALQDQIADFKEQINLELKPLKEEVKNLREDLKSKGRTVHEKVYRFLDEEERMVGFYNSEGMLVSSRPARRDELQKTVFADLRKEGTNN